MIRLDVEIQRMFVLKSFATSLTKHIMTSEHMIIISRQILHLFSLSAILLSPSDSWCSVSSTQNEMISSLLMLISNSLCNIHLAIINSCLHLLKGKDCFDTYQTDKRMHDSWMTMIRMVEELMLVAADGVDGHS